MVGWIHICNAWLGFIVNSGVGNKHDLTIFRVSLECTYLTMDGFPHLLGKNALKCSSFFVGQDCFHKVMRNLVGELTRQRFLIFTRSSIL